MDPEIRDIEYEILALSRHITAAVGRSKKDAERLDESAYTLLNLLAVGGPMSIGELQEILGLDASTLNRQTSAAMRNGLVERRGDDPSGIARRFHLTQVGADRLEADQQASYSALANTLKEWPAEDRVNLTRTLRALNAAIEQRYPQPWPRPYSRDQDDESTHERSRER